MLFALRHSGITMWATLRAPLSGTFLQTLPDFVTPLKGHSLSPCSCPPTRSAPSQRFGVLIKLQVLVYDILPSTIAVFSYAIGSRKLSANEPFFVGAQTVVSLLQTTQIISDICFITDHVASLAQIKLKSFESRRTSFLFFSFFYRGWMRLMFTCVLGR